MFKRMKVLMLAGGLSVLAVSAAQAEGDATKLGNGNGRTAALVTDSGQGAKWRPTLKSPADGTRLAGGDMTDGEPDRSAEVATDPHAMFAGDGGPGTAGDHNGRAELTTNTDQMFAGDTGPGGPTDNTGHAALETDTHQMLATDGPPTGPGGGTSRAELVIDPHTMLASEGPGNPTDSTGRTAALETDDQRLIVVAGGRVGGLGTDGLV